MLDCATFKRLSKFAVASGNIFESLPVIAQHFSASSGCLLAISCRFLQFQVVFDNFRQFLEHSSFWGSLQIYNLKNVVNISFQYKVMDPYGFRIKLSGGHLGSHDLEKTTKPIIWGYRIYSYSFNLIHPGVHKFSRWKKHRRWTDGRTGEKHICLQPIGRA